MRLRAEARAHGAEEAAILNGRGEVIEAAGCSVVWWRGEALFRVAASEPILDGVTQRLLAELARRLDVQFTESSLSVEEVCEHEVWLVNALIGIVPVIGWVDRCERSPLDSSRLATWRAGLAELALPVG
jgi:branched-subunit amino acid aminotransferase/4-amino-4-deoxychorismate lyase